MRKERNQKTQEIIAELKISLTIKSDCGIL